MLIELLKADPVMGFMELLHIDDMGMRGPDIWIGYKDHCNSDLAAFRRAIVERDPAMVAAINQHRGRGPGRAPVVVHGTSFV